MEPKQTRALGQSRLTSHQPRHSRNWCPDHWALSMRSSDQPSHKRKSMSPQPGYSGLPGSDWPQGRSLAKAPRLIGEAGRVALTVGRFGQHVSGVVARCRCRSTARIRATVGQVPSWKRALRQMTTRCFFVAPRTAFIAMEPSRVTNRPSRWTANARRYTSVSWRGPWTRSG